MATSDLHDTPYSWVRLGVTLAIAAVGNVGMWAVIVVLPAVQAEFGGGRAEASVPYTMTMMGFCPGEPRHWLGRGPVRDHEVAGGGIGADGGGVRTVGGCRIDRRSVCHPFRDRVRVVGLFRAAHRRYLALVPEAAGDRRGDHGVGELPVRRDLAPASDGCDCGTRVAGGLYRAGPVGGRACGAPVAVPAAAGVGGGRGAGRDAGGGAGPVPAPDAGPVAGSAVRCRDRLLRGDVHAAGSYRRLLRGPGLWPGGRGRDAVAHAAGWAVSRRGSFRGFWRTGWAA